LAAFNETLCAHKAGTVQPTFVLFDFQPTEILTWLNITEQQETWIQKLSAQTRE
jgi:hypothetical protein